jgi:hypothetical protein
MITFILYFRSYPGTSTGTPYYLAWLFRRIKFIGGMTESIPFEFWSVSALLAPVRVPVRTFTRLLLRMTRGYRTLEATST